MVAAPVALVPAAAVAPVPAVLVLSKKVLKADDEGLVDFTI